MKRKYIDIEHNFIEYFDDMSGFYFRTGTLKKEENGNIIDTNVDPFMRNFPGLIDIGIMGHCKHGESGLCIKSGIECYQNGLNIHKENMSFDLYKKIIDQCEGKVFQVALGGRGDVDQHENFEQIMEYTRSKGIVPNFTSSGFGFNKNIAKICKKYAGAIAISEYRSKYTENALNMLIDEGVTTNIHYVLNTNTIQEAINKLNNNSWKENINAVIFLLHKPVGLGSKEKMLTYDNPKVKEFFEAVDNYNGDVKIGFDSCSIPGILNLTNNILKMSIDTCEAARFSCYITENGLMLPCSFDTQYKKYGVDLNKVTVKEAWDSELFNSFRESFKQSCPNCKDRLNCLGGCPITNEIVLCNRKERKVYAK